MRRTKTTFYWDKDKGTARCSISIRGRTYNGFAFCNPEDKDMMSEKTGEEIAYHRAIIEMLKDEKKNTLQQLKALKDFYYSINNSPRFNPKSYETKMLYRQIEFKEDDIESIDELIEETKRYINHYIEEKDKFYHIIRNSRKKRELEEAHSGNS